MADEGLDAPKDELPSVPDIISDVVSDAAVPGIPAPVRRNLFRAISQLSAAVIDVPVAYLEGKADERRAETAARIKLTNTSAEQIAQQMQTDPEYARVAAQKFGHRVVREQVNLDMISQKATKELMDDSSAVDVTKTEGPDDTINDDWLNAFEMEARLKSTEEMQALFGKVLAGEIRKPGSYSTRTVKILGSLDQNTAKLFVRLCSMCISTLNEDSRVPSLSGNAGDNSLREYGLDFFGLNLLNEHGLIISDYNSWYEFTPCLALPGEVQRAVCIPISYQRRYWGLMPISSEMVNSKLRINCVALTKSGSELSNIVELEPLEEYSQELDSFFASKGFRMIELGDGNPQIISVDTLNGSNST